MSAGVRCPHCNLMHSVRSDGLCPRCRRDVAAPPMVVVTPASTPPARRSRAPVYLLVVVALAVGSGFGYQSYRARAAIDYSVREGLLEPVSSGAWVESLDASARVQIVTRGWYRHTNQDADRILLSNPESDTHVVLRVEATGRGQRTPHSGTLADRAAARLEQKVTSLEITNEERLTTAVGNALRFDAEAWIDQTRLVYRYRLAAKPGRVATLVCFGPPDTNAVCPSVLESFAWSS